MNSIDLLISKLSGFMALENEKTHEEIAGYIVGELIGDLDGKYEGLEESQPVVARIADLASDLEWSNGSSDELAAMWQELKRLVEELKTDR